ncbi:MAG: LysR family transcriptional regulator [Planctomycetes bacterium]|nr:LysR family transcriptional regulator [Planctomycetota bacterium]
MQLRALKIFCDVVRQRSFSRAADENDISQSGASQVVHQLEQSLGVKLIDRSKRPFVLTPEGEEYYEGCRGVVERYFALEDRVRTLHQDVVGRVRVASIYSVGLHHMNRYLQEFLTQHPKANVRLEYLHPNRVYQSIEDDVADLGLISYPKPSRTLQAIQWREEPMVLVVAPGHRLAGAKHVSLGQLDRERMIGFDRDLTIRNEIDRVLNQHRVEVQVVMEFDNIETIKRAIEIDAGIGLLPEPTVQREVQAGTLVAVPLDTDELVRPLGIIHRRGKELSSTAERFIELLLREGGHVGGEIDAGSAAGDSPNGKPAAESPVPAGASHHDQADAAQAASQPGRRGGKHRFEPAGSSS